MGNGELSASEFSELTSVLYSASLGQVSWTHFLDDLNKRLGGGIRTHIVGFDNQTGYGVDLATSGYAPEFVKSFREYYAEINAWAPGFMARPVGTFTDAYEMCRLDVLQKTEFFADWVRPQEDIVGGGGALLFKDANRTFAFAGNIRRRDREALQSPWLRLVNQLVPHLQQAFEITRALSGSRLETAIVAQHGLRTVPGIVVLSESGKITFANGVAQAMFDRGVPIAVDHWGRLSIGQGPDQAETSILHQRLAGPTLSFTLSIPAGLDGQGFNLLFAKLTPEAGYALPIDPILGHSGKCTLLIVTQKRQANGVAETLSARHGLTQTEAEVALMVGKGLTLREISESRAVSIHTVRAQIKAGMIKLGVHRQAELVREIQALSSSHSPIGR